MKIVAMVRMNSGFAYVFDEPIQLKYHREVIDGCAYLIGKHGPFRSFLKYRRSRGRNDRAFAGRTLRLRGHNGVTVRVKNHWWNCADPRGETISIAASTVDELKQCYVFSGCSCDPEALQEMVDEYNNRTCAPYNWVDGGYIYPYRDFERVITFESHRKRFYERLYELEQQNKKLQRDKRNLIAEARRQAALAG